MINSVESNLKALRLSKKAFSIDKSKRETLVLALEQIEPILKQYVSESDILQLEVNIEDNSVVALEPISNGQRDFWVKQWLKDKVSTERLNELMDERFEWVEYSDIAVFLDGVESWAEKKAGMND